MVARHAFTARTQVRRVIPRVPGTASLGVSHTLSGLLAKPGIPAGHTRHIHGAVPPAGTAGLHCGSHPYPDLARAGEVPPAGRAGLHCGLNGAARWVPMDACLRPERPDSIAGGRSARGAGSRSRCLRPERPDSIAACRMRAGVSCCPRSCLRPERPDSIAAGRLRLGWAVPHGVPPAGTAGLHCSLVVSTGPHGASTACLRPERPDAIAATRPHSVSRRPTGCFRLERLDSIAARFAWRSTVSICLRLQRPDSIAASKDNCTMSWTLTCHGWNSWTPLRHGPGPARCRARLGRASGPERPDFHCG